MASWKRITLVVFVLIGGTISFSYWSFSQFNTALSDLEATLTANIPLASSFLKKDATLASISFETTLTADMLLASSSPETDAELASPSLETSKAPATPTSLAVSFTFPQKGDEVYIGCTYPISWQSSAIIHSLGAVLIDAGARESIGPIASGLAEENAIETDSQNVNWQVGAVWPGEYYIKVTTINGTDVEMRSEIFTINKISKSIRTEERESMCKKSGGLF